MDLIALSRLGGRHLVTLHLLLDSRSVTRSAARRDRRARPVDN